MKKKIVDHIHSSLPTVFSNIAKILKENFDENGQEILQSGTGTAAIIVKLFGQPAIDKYFDQLSETKLENHGLSIYIKAGFKQADESLVEIESRLKKELDYESKFNFLNQHLKLEGEKLKKEDILLIFKPKYHPAIISIKRHYENILMELETPLDAIRNFTKHFNDHIEEKVKDEFGDDYDKHLEETKEYKLKDSETDFLWEMVSLERIGFKESENLIYEQTYASWRAVSEFKTGDNNDPSDIEKQEESLEPIQDLIEQYFEKSPINRLDNILFLLADFGKGKSVFLRHYAAQFARQYFEKKEGFFPVYFNLRNFSNYSSETKLGVISDYLETDYGIKIDSEYFKNNNYIFLIDSLDESGELTQSNIDKVIASIKKIQNIDKTECRNNRIVISSRPFDEGLETHLCSHKPYTIENSEKREIPYFIAIYGFKKYQFNDWLKNTLKRDMKNNVIQKSDLAKDILDIIKGNKAKDFYQLLQNNKTLSDSELKRPIFAYMIYQLIINNIDFSTIGKIGVYLSFLNLLTKDAKHINDTNYKVNLLLEFEFRNLLHSISALWMYERQQGKQGVLKKADICRVLDGENKRETDTEILKRYNDEEITEVQFLSHSYFGEKDNNLHFQHQSFAEILLAEYYLKVFIKYALDENCEVEEARAKLILGEPTEQTIHFLKEMLKLLKETAVENSGLEVIEKRKLLFPLMASLATKKNNKLFCNNIFYSWFKVYPFKENEANYPHEALQNWCIDNDKLERIIRLARDIIESKTTYIMAQAETKSALYDNELLVIQSGLYSHPPDIDRWLALLVGNDLYTDIESNHFFNWSIANYTHLFDLIKNWNHSFNNPAPEWAFNLFMGINMKSNERNYKLNNLNLSGINMSYSHIRYLSLAGCDLTFFEIRECVEIEYLNLVDAHHGGDQFPPMLINIMARGGRDIFKSALPSAVAQSEFCGPSLPEMDWNFSGLSLLRPNLRWNQWITRPYPVFQHLVEFGVTRNFFDSTTVQKWIKELKAKH